jgi:hypothetical protein
MVTGTQPRKRELSCSGKFAGKSNDDCTVSVIVGGRTAGPGLINDPGPAFLSEASTPLTDGFPCTLELSCYLGVVEASCSEENNPCSEHFSLRAGRFASDRFKISSILSGQRDSDRVGTWRHVLPSWKLVTLRREARKQLQIYPGTNFLDCPLAVNNFLNHYE